MVTKNQHYVPQLLLRRFAVKERINVYDVERGEFRTNQNIRNVCAGNYTYDKDNSIETFLHEQIESPATSELDKLAALQRSLQDKPSPALLRFIMAQIARTRAAYEGNMAFVNGFMRTVFVELARLNGMNTDAAAKLSIEPKEPRAVLSYMMLQAITQYRLIQDLAVCLVVNRSNEEFIISDHPIFQHNWYLRDCAEPVANAITVRGIQFFFPISSSITCCLYDPAVYAYKCEPRTDIVMATREDVEILNTFQAINADSQLLAKSERMGDTLGRLGETYRNRRPFTSSATHVPASEHDDESLRSTHMVVRLQTRVPKMPSFIKVRNKVRRASTLNCSHRCPEVVLEHELARRELIRRMGGR